MTDPTQMKRDVECRNLLERTIANILFWVLLLFLFIGIFYMYWVPLKTLLFG